MFQGIDDGSVRVAVRKINDFKLLLGGIVLTLILGMAGFSRVFPDFNALTWLYMSMQLFLLDPQSFDVSDVLSSSESQGQGIPWTLELARWMAAAITCYGILFAVWKFLLHSTGNFKISRIKGHIIVFGSGSVVDDLLNDALKTETDCVLLTSCSSLIVRWRKMGGLAVEITASADQPDITEPYLKQAGLNRASTFYAFDTADSENLRAAMLAQSLKSNVRIVVRQDEPFACGLLQRNGLLLPSKDSSLRVFSVANTRARLLLHQTPLEWHPINGLATEVHLVIPCLGIFEKAIAIQAALIGHYANGVRANLWLDSSTCRSRLLADFPGISKCIDINVIGENNVNTIHDISHAAAPGALVTILATNLLPEEGYLQTLRYRERWSSENSFRVILKSPLADGDLLVSGADYLYVAPQLRDLATPGALDKHDRLAKQIHDTWYEGNQRRIDDAQAEGETAEAEQLQQKSTFKPWGELTEEQKDINRTAADHIEIKIRAVGLDPEQPDLLQAWKKLTPEQLDLLSEMEHERWCAPLWLSGYKLGDRDDDTRKHPNLVPYDELDQSTKDYDTEQVKMAAQYLAVLRNQEEE